MTSMCEFKAAPQSCIKPGWCRKTSGRKYLQSLGMTASHGRMDYLKFNFSCLAQYFQNFLGRFSSDVRGEYIFSYSLFTYSSST